MLAVFALLLLAGVALFLLARWLHRRSGMPQGEVIYSDTGAWKRNERSFFSPTLHVTGKPDYLLRDGQRIIPVELKSGPAPATPREGHVLQLAVYCLLVEENLGQRPPYGLIRYADRSFTVHYTDELRRIVLDTIDQMRRDLTLPNGPHRDHDSARRCATCGLRESCNERLA
jgi:CRISPR-associated exonuclease Cas4